MDPNRWTSAAGDSPTSAAATGAHALTAGYRAGFFWTAGLMVLTGVVAAGVPRDVGVVAVTGESAQPLT